MRLSSKLRDESGIALIMALGVMLVLTIALISTIAMTSSGSGNASRSNADQKAHALAEAGISNAVSVISKGGPGATIGPPPTGAYDGAWSKTTFEGGTAWYGGTIESANTWEIKSIGAVKNPTGPGSADVIRTVTARVKLNPPPFTFVSLNKSCDNHTLVVRLGGNLTVTSNVYVNSCSLDDGFDIFGGGNISAPEIKTHGGWESQNYSSVTVGGIPCQPPAPYDPGTGRVKVPPPQTWPGCPLTGQPLVTDPLAGQVTVPSLGASAWGGDSAPITITGVYRSGNVATLQTSSNTVTAGDSIVVSGVGSGFDGTFTVLGSPAPTSTKLSYSNTAAAVSNTITAKQLASGTATLTTSQAHALSVGDSVTIAGVDNVLNNGPYLVTGVPSPTSFTYTRARAPFTRSTGTVALAAGLATLTLTANANVVVPGDIFSVAGYTGNNAVLNGGPFTATSTTTDNSLKYANPATTTINLSSATETIATGTTVRINVANTVAVGDTIVVNTNDTRVNGTFTVSARGNGDIRYVLPAAPATSITGGSVTAGAATLSANSAPPFYPGDTVTVDTGDLRFDGTFALTGVNAAAKTFSYTPAFVQANSWTWNSTTHVVTQTVTTPPHGLRAGDTISVTASKNCLNGPSFQVLASPAPTTNTFSYLVPDTCNPGAPSGGENGRAAIITAAATPLSGQATLVTGAAVLITGTITVPGSIASVTTTCANCISATGNIAATTLGTAGTYTSSGLPAFVKVSAGSFIVRRAGGPTTPALREIKDSGTSTLPEIGAAGGTFTYYGGLCIGVPYGVSCSSDNCKAPKDYTANGYNNVGLTAQVGSIGPTGGSLTVTTGGGTSIRNGDYIKMDNEKLLVVSGGGTPNLTVSRGVLDTAPSNIVQHTNKTIQYIVGTPNVTMANGTYIMAGGGFFVCGAATVNAPHVLIVNTNDVVSGTEYAALDQIQFDTIGTITLGPPDTGIYQGLSIYQPVNHAMSDFKFDHYSPVQKLAEAIDDSQTNIKLYGGGTVLNGDLIYVDAGTPNAEVMRVVSGAPSPNLVVERGDTLTPGSDTNHAHAKDKEVFTVTGDKCDGRDPKKTDILLSGIGNKINGMTGSIYAPHAYALFTDAVGGESSIAVMTGCIFINGANSTFSFEPETLFGAATVEVLGIYG